MVVSPKQGEIEYVVIERQREDKNRKIKQGGEGHGGIQAGIWRGTTNTKDYFESHMETYCRSFFTIYTYKKEL